jgi:hypothetical protein
MKKGLYRSKHNGIRLLVCCSKTHFETAAQSPNIALHGVVQGLNG